MFRPFLVIATHRQPGWSSPARIAPSMFLRSAAGVVSSLCASGTLVVSTMQNLVSGVGARDTGGV